jgi:hypothetical protein
MMEIIVDILAVAGLSLIPATFGYFLDYALGHPMSETETSTKAIFFRYSLWLAARRLSVQKKQELVAHFADGLNSSDRNEKATALRMYRLSVMQAGRELFFYEQAIGMCPYCTNFWLCQITALILFYTTPLSFINPAFFFLIIPIFSHTILRKL